MKILKTMVTVQGDNKIFECDTIEHAKGLWLVPQWLSQPEEGWSTPARIIRLDTLDHNKTTLGGADYLLKYPIPKGVLDGRISPQEATGYDVVDRPDIKIPLRRAN